MITRFTKKLIKKGLARFGYTAVPSNRLNELTVPLNCVNVARLLYFENLINKTRTVKGDIVECGVGWGHSLLILSLLVKIDSDDRLIWGFDSFEGFPDPTPEDLSYRNLKKGENSVDIERIYKLLIDYIGDEHFIRSKICLIKGFFNNTLDTFPIERISLLNLDVDLYESYKVCLEKLYPKLSVGGIVTFDEYINESYKFPGALKAINNFFAEKDAKFERDPYYGNFFLVKTSSD